MDLRHKINFLPKDLPKVNAEKTGRKPHRQVAPRGRGIRPVDQGTKLLPMATWEKSVHML